MGKNRLFTAWNKKSSGAFRVEVLKDIKNSVLKHSTCLGYAIDNFAYKSTDIARLNKLDKKLVKLNKKILKIIK